MSWECQGGVKGVSSECHGSVKGAPWECQREAKRVTGGVKGVSSGRQGIVNGVSRHYLEAGASRGHHGSVTWAPREYQVGAMAEARDCLEAPREGHRGVKVV